MCSISTFANVCVQVDDVVLAWCTLCTLSISSLDALQLHGLVPLYLMSVTGCAQVDSRELQVLYPLLEFLHHHRLNAADAPALADAFAPLLMRLECDGAPKDQDCLPQAYGLLLDMLIQRYRTLFSGKATLYLTPFAHRGTGNIPATI